MLMTVLYCTITGHADAAMDGPTTRSRTPPRRDQRSPSRTKKHKKSSKQVSTHSSSNSRTRRAPSPRTRNASAAAPGPSNHVPAGTSAPPVLNATSNRFPTSARVITPPSASYKPAAVIVNGLAEYLPNASVQRILAQQDDLYIPEHLGYFDLCSFLYTDVDTVNFSIAKVFGIFLRANAHNIRRNVNRLDMSAEDKQPCSCHASCPVQTFPMFLEPIMASLKTKHDDWCITVATYIPRTRSEVFTPKQLQQYCDGHADVSISNADRLKFARNVLVQCFTLDIEGLSDERDPGLLHLDKVKYGEFPRVDMAYVNDFFPNLRCFNPGEVRELCQALLSVNCIEGWYSQGCINLDRLRHPEVTTHILQAPTLTILNCDNGIDETGAFSRGSLVYNPPRLSSAVPVNQHPGRSCLHENSLPRVARASVRFAGEVPLVAPLAAVASTYIKPTPVTSTRVVYSYADTVADNDAVVAPFPACTNVQKARDYLTRNQPIRTHAIWTTLVLWNRENSKLLTGPQPDFLTWWDRFSAQAADHNLPASVSWRIANRLLPEHIQASVIQSCQEPSFPGYNQASWAQFVTRETGGKDCVLIAYDQLRALRPEGKESLSSFLMRFQILALRSTSVSSLLEAGLTCDVEFKLLHSLMTNHARHFGRWVSAEWHAQYNKHASMLRELPIQGYSDEQKQLVVRTAIRALISYMRSIDAMKQDEVNLLPPDGDAPAS